MNNIVLKGANTPWPPIMWADVPKPDRKRTNNGTEAFHRHLHSMLCCAHPINIYVLVEALPRIQANTYSIHSCQVDTPALVKLEYRTKTSVQQPGTVTKWSALEKQSHNSTSLRVFNGQ